MGEEEFVNPSIFEAKKYYEWKSGALAGVVEVYAAEANEVAWFESGRSVSIEQLDIQLRRIDESDYNIKREVLPGISNDVASSIPLGNPVPAPVEANPIRIILNKQKKFEFVELEYPISIKIPSRKVLDLLTMMFDEDEVNEEVGKFVVEMVDENVLTDFKEFIIESVKKQLNLKEGEQLL